MEGRVSIEDSPQSDHISSAIDNTSIAIVTIVLDEDRTVMVRSEAQTGILWTKVYRILTEHLIKKKVAG